MVLSVAFYKMSYIDNGLYCIMGLSGEPMTFEDLTSLYRMEKKSTFLAEARKDLYPALAQLLAGIQKEYERQLTTDPDSIITDGLNERRKKMVDFSQRIVDLRMNKILILALRGAMGSDKVLDKLTSEEKEFYEKVLANCRSHRSYIDLRRKKEIRIPDILDHKAEFPPIVEPVPESVRSISTTSAGPLEVTLQESLDEEEEKSDDLVLRIIEDLPTFSGPDRDYNLRREDVVRMPRPLAMALVNKEKAVLVDVRP